MNITIYEIYVDGVFQECWESRLDAGVRAYNIETELGEGRVKLLQNDYSEVVDWKYL